MTRHFIQSRLGLVFLPIILSFAALGGCFLDWDSEQKRTEDPVAPGDGGHTGADGGNEDGSPSGLVLIEGGLRTVNDPRSDSTRRLTLHDDGFERGERVCSRNGLCIVSGGFEP